MNLLNELTPERRHGPFGALKSGDAAEPVEHFPGFGDLSDPAKDEVSAVWAGRAKQCLLFVPATNELLFLRHAEDVPERSGKRYGYYVWTISIPAAPQPATPLPPRSGGGLRSAGLLILVPLLMAGAFFVGRSNPLNPSQPSPGQSISTNRADLPDERKSLLDARERELASRKQALDEREAVVKQAENDYGARLDRIEKSLDALLKTIAKLNGMETTLRDMKAEIEALKTKGKNTP